MWGVDFFFYFVSFYVSVVLVLTFEVSFCAVRLQKNGADSNMEDLQHNPSSRKYFAQ